VLDNRASHGRVRMSTDSGKIHRAVFVAEHLHCHCDERCNLYGR
jgi:hypothetical protein